MNKLKISFLAVCAVAAVLLVGGCSTDFDLTAEPEEVIVAYSLINPAETQHFVRIQKAYLDENTSALTIAGINDSLYHSNNLSVEVVNNNNGAIYTLEKVYGDSIGLVKDTGLFANSPNVLYSFSGGLSESDYYSVRINNPNSGESVSGSFNIVNDFSVYRPRPLTELNLSNPEGTFIRWEHAIDAAVYDMFVVFHYKEWNVNTPSLKQNKTVVWKALSSFDPGNTEEGKALDAIVQGQELYRILSNTLEDDDELIRQYDDVKGMNFVFWAGGQEYYDFIRVKRAQSSIGSNNSLPSFTNVNGGLGIISSRLNIEVQNVLLNPSSRDSLACGIITGDMNFLKPNGTLCN